MGKRLLAVMLSLLLSIGTLSPAYSKAYSNSEGAINGFNYYWANQLLNEWIVNNNIAEDDSRVIYPNTEIARGEFVVLLEDVFEHLDGNKERIYYNLPSDWWVDEHGVIDKNDILLPTDQISREDASELLCDIFGLSADLSEVNIPDMSSVSAQNKAAVKVMVQTGYLKLYPDGWFHPEQNVTISQVARAINFISMYLYHNDKLANLKTSPLGANLISNGGFDQPLSSAVPDALGNVDTENSWIFFTNNGGDGTCVIEDGMARVNVTNNAGVPDYGVQLIQAPVTLKKGDVYKIIFDAKSTEARNVSIKMGSTGDKGWLAYNSTQTVQIDNVLKTYSMEFTMAQPDDANARMELFFAASTAPVWVDNIKLYKVDHTDLITLDDLLNRTNTEADEDLVEDWQLAWDDEFDGTQLNTDYWNYDVGWGPFDNGWGNFEKEYYVPENVSVENGNLVIKITEEERTVYEADGKPFTTYYSSGRINTKGKVMPKYGRIEVRAKLLTGDALWPAVWMIGSEWPESAWPQVGEIDMVELLGQEPNKIYGTVHSPLSYQNGFAGEGQTYVLEQGTFADDFHEYAIEWDEDEIEYYIDGMPFHIINKDEITYKYGPGNWAFDHEFYLIANIAAGGFFPGQPNENTIVPNQMEIDYMRIYEDANPAVVTEEVVDCANELPEPVPGIDAFSNGTFDADLDSWGTYIHYDAAANIGVENGEAKINVQNEGNELWSIQLYQGPFKLDQAKTYSISFDARADVARKFQVIVENGEYVTFLNEAVDLTTTMNHYTLTFTMPSSEEASLKFMAGKVQELVGLPHNVYIDNVQFVESQAPVKAITELANGTFEGNLGPWNQYIHYDALATMSVENNEFKATIANQGAETWGVQLYQGVFSAYAGKQYTVEFDARSDIDRDIQVIVDNTNYNAYLSEIVSINSTMSTYKCTFTMPGDDMVSLKFLLGNVNGSLAPHNVYLDNIRVYEEVQEKAITELANGTFDSTLSPWNQYIHYDALATMSVENNEFKAAIENQGLESWGVQLYQGPFAAYAGKQYTLEFDARSDIDRDIQVIVDNTNYNAYLSEIVSINGTMSTYKCTFIMPGDDIVSLKIMLGNVNGSIAPHNVYLDNIRVYEEAPVSVPSVPKLNFDENLIDNTAWQGWWGDEWSGYSSGNLSVVDDQINVDITSVGGASYSPQVYQEGLTFENGAEYIVTFTAHADAPKPILLNIGQALTYDPWFMQYTGTQAFNLTTEPTNYIFKFTMNEPTYNNGKIVFELGTINGDSTVAAVHLSNVNIVKVDNSINNSNWTSWWGDQWSGYSSGTLTTADSVLTIDLTSIGYASYSPQIIQEGLTFENGKEYLVMFNVKGNAPRPINVQVGRALDNDPWFLPYVPVQTVNIGADYTTYAFSFVMNEATYNNGKIVFELGTINGDATVTSVEIKDVLIMDNARVLE